MTGRGQREWKIWATILLYFWVDGPEGEGGGGKEWARERVMERGKQEEVKEG